jgi:GTP-binding protein YchF
MQVGIVGLPNVGKSTLFNALTKASVKVDNYPFCTTDHHDGVAELADERLDLLFGTGESARKTPTIVRFVDIAGLVKGASRGEGLGNKFLHHIREVDSILHVVRCFDDDQISHVDGTIDPVRDVQTIETELLLTDLQTVDKRKEKVGRQAKSGLKELQAELSVLEKIETALNEARPVRTMELSSPEQDIVDQYYLLTSKEILFMANVDEDSLAAGGNRFTQELENYTTSRGNRIIQVCAKLESELAELDPDEAKEFIADLGLTESGMQKVIRESYDVLNLITFFTMNPNEVRATSIRRGSTAAQAAGKIHTDMERGFIKAEVVHFEEFKQAGRWSLARDQGLLRAEGRDYVVQDGDIIYFRFNV